MLKKMLPVAVGLVLILLIAITVSGVKKATNRTPAVDDATKVYAKYGDYEITKDRIYTLMKNNYGVSETLNWVDEQLYADEISAIDVTSAEYISYVKNAIFGTDDFTSMTNDEKEAAQEAWDDVLSSLQISNILSKADATDSAFDSESSKAWTTVKDYYKVQYAREEYAKKAYLEQYYANSDYTEEKPFAMTNAEDSTNSIEAYYEANYSDKVIALFIPFSSLTAAKAMMKEVGINVDSNVLTANDGWIKSSYDYYTKAEIEESDKMTYKEVVEAFFAMYNKVYAYLNSGADVITTSDYTESVGAKQTAYLVASAVEEALASGSFGRTLNLPTSVTINGEANAATIEWSTTSDKYAEINSENVLVGTFENGDKVKDTDNQYSVDVVLNYTIKFNEESVLKTSTIEMVAELVSEATYQTPAEGTWIDTLTISAVDPFKTVSFTEEFLAKEFEYCNFIWDDASCDAVNEALCEALIGDSASLKISDDPAKIFNSYTVSPITAGNYSFLILKLGDIKGEELFVKDENGNNAKDANGEYQIANQELYDEIVKAKLEELVDDNAISEMIYENRYNHGLKLFDSYIEAIYEYEYTNFYETTLSKSDYNEFDKTKKNKKTIVASIQLEEGKKKSAVELSAEQLFAKMEAKYATNYVTSLIDNYILISNKEYNDIYNPYTKETYNKDALNDLVTSEIATLKKNFEADYFTYSYLSYYGFTPNFPAKYGWAKFIKDYFIAFDDYELLTVSTYGGSIYSNALTKLTQELDLDLIMAEMQDNSNNWFSTTVYNLLITVDFNYDADDANENNSANIIAEKDHWTPELDALAAELAEFLYKVAPQTGGANLNDQMNSLVTLYKEAAYEYDETAFTSALGSNTSIYDFNYFGKYKLAGLSIKWESAKNYDATSSIVDEFKEECVKLWNKADQLGLMDKTFDAPLLSDMVFTDYGWHKIACTGASAKVELPTLDEVKAYRAITNLSDAKAALDTAKENLETYSAQGYNVSSYEAAVKTAEADLAKAEAEVTALGLALDYELDEDAKERIDAWYTNAETTVDGGTLVTRYYLNTIDVNKLEINSSVISKETFSNYFELVIAECDKADNE